jgi:hypothetical protein
MYSAETLDRLTMNYNQTVKIIVYITPYNNIHVYLLWLASDRILATRTCSRAFTTADYDDVIILFSATLVPQYSHTPSVCTTRSNDKVISTPFDLYYNPAAARTCTRAHAPRQRRRRTSCTHEALSMTYL